MPMLQGGGLRTLFLQLAYPVGTYFINDSVNFNTVDKVKAYMGFGTWEAVPEGTFLEATRTTSLASSNNKHSAGLPNITGDFHFSYLTCSNNWTAGNGALKNTYRTDPGKHAGAGSSQVDYDLYVKFDASNSSTIYNKDCTTVQPKSQLTYAYRRIS